MAQLAFKGIQLVKKATFESAVFTKDKSILYFVRTNENMTDGYMQLNGKKYGTGADVIAKYGELDNKTIAQYVKDYVATEIGKVNSAATGLGKKVATNATAIETINGEGEGSIKKALSDAKGYTDTAKIDIIGTAGDASTADTIKGAKKGVEEAKDAAAKAKTAADNAQKAADAKVATVSGENAINVDSTTATAPKVSLVLDPVQGNVKLSQSATGLKAEVEIPAATVTGVKADDKFLSLVDKLVSADVSIAYDAADKKIYLYGKDKTKANAVSSIDCKDFIKDGMLTDAELVTNPEGQDAGTYIKLTWNTDGDKQPMYINVTSLIDVYTAKADGGLKLEDHAFSVDTTKIATVDLVNGVTGRVATLESKVGSAAVGETGATGLYKDIANNKSAIAIETARATKAEQANANAIATLNGDDTVVGSVDKKIKDALEAGAVTLEVKDNDAYLGVTSATTEGKGTVYTLASNEAAINKAIKDAADAVKVSVTNGTYVKGSVDAAGRAITLSEKVQKVETSSADAKGLAEASDVKAYVDGKVSSKNVTATGDTYVSATATNNKVTVGATEALTSAVNKAKTAVQSVNGVAGTAVVIKATDIEVGAGVGEQAETAKVDTVLADIYTKLGVVVKADGTTIKEGADHKLSVNLEAKETAQANGHVALEHGTDGALYGVMYYSGDDAE